MSTPSRIQPRFGPETSSPTRLELLRAVKGRPFAGEVTPAPETFRVTSGIINYTGHMPGLQSSISTPYPKMVKKSEHYQKERSRLWGDTCRSVKDSTHDAWGNLKRGSPEVRRYGANMYLLASNPEADYDLDHGIGKPWQAVGPDAQVAKTFFSHTAASGLSDHALSPSRNLPTDGPVVPQSRVPCAEPAHIVGYTGHQPNTRAVYGENFNRVDSRVKAAALPRAHGRPEPESDRFMGGYEVHNLVLNNKATTRH